MTKPKRRQRPTTSPFYSTAQTTPDPERFEKGDRVTHDRYGLGRVTSLDGDTAVCVDFGDGSVHVPLEHRVLHRL